LTAVMSGTAGRSGNVGFSAVTASDAALAVALAAFLAVPAAALTAFWATLGAAGPRPKKYHSPSARSKRPASGPTHLSAAAVASSAVAAVRRPAPAGGAAAARGG